MVLLDPIELIVRSTTSEELRRMAALIAAELERRVPIEGTVVADLRVAMEGAAEEATERIKERERGAAIARRDSMPLYGTDRTDWQVDK